MRKCFAIILILMLSSVSIAEEITEVQAPVWEEYVPPKYHNPNTSFSRGSSIAEMVVGEALTAFLILAPIGIPMIIHGGTKLKHISYANKKEKFYEGLEEANQITSPSEKQKYYNKLLKKLGLSEKNHNRELQRIAKEEQKQQKKELKQQQKKLKQQQKENKKQKKTEELQAIEK